MQRDETVIWQILERIEKDEEPQVFFEGEVRWPDGEYEWSRPNWSDLEAYHVDLMVEAGLLQRKLMVGEPWQSGGERDTFIVLTAAGHDHLQSRRENTKLRKTTRVFGFLLDRAFASILAPILVAVLTVLAMRYFGLVGTG